MKKTLLIFLSLLLSVSLPISLISCGNTADTDGSSADKVSGGDTSKPEEPTEPIVVENGLSVKMPSDRPIKIAQFADLHFGVEGSPYHNDKLERTKKYMQYVAETAKPDLIVCSGDNVMSTGVEKLKEFVAFMEGLKTPWTFVYGNHDAENHSAGYSKKEMSDYLDTCDAEYLLFNSGYVEASNNRYGNFSISVLNDKGTKLLGAVLIFDSGIYSGSIGTYESLTEGQINWYKSEIDKLNALYTGEGTMPSIVFSHIQIPEYYTAYKKALANDGAKFIIEQELSDYYIESIKNDGPTNVNTGMFDAMKEKQSTVAFFCGHAHLFDFQVEMDDIVLGFGPQSGFSTLFPDNDMPRRTYVYNFDEKFDFTTEVCVEDGKGLGLTYSGSFDDTAAYDEASGTYKASYNFNYGNEIVFAFDGVRLDSTNTTFTGDISESTTSEYKGGFYSPDGMTLIYDGTKACTCEFVYDPSAKTITVTTKDIETDPNAPTSVKYSTLNSDAGADAIALWTNPGTKLKSVPDITVGGETWIGNGWRYYVVVDAEGRIAYAVLWPLSGYGGPTGSSYYTHTVYASDYSSNPAITILDGFKNDWADGGFGYTLFEIVIPEGGFAFTSHGNTNYEIIDMLSQGTVEDYDVGNINTRTIYNSNIRVSYDTATKTISITTED